MRGCSTAAPCPRRGNAFSSSLRPRHSRSKDDPLAVFDATDHVWNLVDKGRVFEEMLQEPTILAM